MVRGVINIHWLSALGWKDNSQVLLAANSLGTISIMQLD